MVGVGVKVTVSMTVAVSMTRPKPELVRRRMELMRTERVKDCERGDEGLSRTVDSSGWRGRACGASAQPLIIFVYEYTW